MIFGVYSIRDHLSGFQTPVIEQNDALALRNFQMAIDQYPRERGATLMSWRPSDFDFFKIGEFDSSSGRISPLVPPELISSGLSISNSKEAPSDVKI